jgi:hypothetical protein
MKWISRKPAATPAEIAELAAAHAEAEVTRERRRDQWRREKDEADRETRRRRKREAERAEKKRRKELAKARARRRRQLARLATSARDVVPLLIVNAVTVGGQLAYVYDETPATWAPLLRVAVAVGVATAAESVALYVGWHAHDALLAKAYSTATWLRRASYAIAGLMAAVNYSHFVDDVWAPSALGVIFGVLSSLSPWLWGLHTRRAQHVQLIREELVDETGAVFAPARRRAFPVRAWQARRWSIDHNIRDPKRAWEGYNAERRRRTAHTGGGRIRAALRVLRHGALPAPAGEPMTAQERQLVGDARAAARVARHTIGASAAALNGLTPTRYPSVPILAEPTHDLRLTAPAVAPEPVRPAVDEPTDREPVTGPRRSWLSRLTAPRGAAEPARPAADEPTRDEPETGPEAPVGVVSESTHPVPTHQPEQADESTHRIRRASRTPVRAAHQQRPVITARVDESDTDSRLEEAYARLTKRLDREPSGAQLGLEAGVSKATANRWKERQRAGSPADSRATA